MTIGDNTAPPSANYHQTLPWVPQAETTASPSWTFAGIQEYPTVSVFEKHPGLETLNDAVAELRRAAIELRQHGAHSDAVLADMVAEAQMSLADILGDAGLAEEDTPADDADD